MKYLSTFSGIEAATVAWHPLGWEPVGFSEIEPFPCAVLKHHYPDVKNYGDITKFNEWDLPPFDLLVGGSPCQSFSVAGLRKGLEDPRGNLMLTFLALADKHKPNWIVWENVPGVLSSNDGKDFECFLNGLEEIGYIVDVDILDAQFFGLAQRRKRVFVCGIRKDIILNQKTIFSALTLMQWMTENLQLALTVLSVQLGQGSEDWDSVRTNSAHSLQRKMKLFGKDLERVACILADLLEEVLPLSESGPRESDLESGNRGSRTTMGTELSAQGGGDGCQSIERSLKTILAESLAIMNESTTSTATSETTESRIYGCAKALLHIARRITPSMASCPNFWSAASSCLIVLKEYINYARSTSSNLFANQEMVQHWSYFIREAEQSVLAISGVGVECWGEVFPVANSLSGNPQPSREKGKGTAGSFADGIGNESDAIAFDERNIQLWSNQNMETSPAITATDYKGAKGVAHAFKMRGGCEGGGKGYLGQDECAFTLSTHQDQQIAQPIGFDAYNQCLTGHVSKTISSANSDICHTGGVLQPVTYDMAQVTAPQNKQSRTPGDPCHTLAKDNAGNAAIVQQYAVRRLTPIECERLQGFPDNYTAIPWRGKDASQCPDGPRYKALGNSMAVPVMRWIGERIQEVEKIMDDVRRTDS